MYQKRHIQKKQIKIVYVGRLERDTGLPILLKALEKNKSINIEFIGDGSLRSECEKYGKVHGFVNNPEHHVKKARICIVSGYLTALEAMVNKCKVIALFNNPLKHDYWKLTPFSKWIMITNKLESININNSVNNKAYDWVEKQSWKQLVDKYIYLWK